MPSADRPAEPVGYHRLHRLGRAGAGRSLSGVLLVVVGWILLSYAVVGVLEGLGFDVTLDPFVPSALFATDAVWALAILLVLLLTKELHHLPLGLVASVVGRIRWRWLLACFGLAAVALGAAVAVSLFFPQQPGTEMSGQINPWTDRLRDFVLIVVLLTPLQSAGEEFVFRGYLTQAFGGLLSDRRTATVVAVVVPALLFAIAHGSQSAPVFVDRFAFGAVAGVLALRTGGLEAGIAMHLLNNWLSLGLALALGDIDAAINPEGGTWGILPGTLTQSLLYLALVLWAVRRSDLETVTEGGVLVGPEGHR